MLGFSVIPILSVCFSAYNIFIAFLVVFYCVARSLVICACDEYWNIPNVAALVYIRKLKVQISWKLQSIQLLYTVRFSCGTEHGRTGMSKVASSFTAGYHVWRETSWRLLSAPVSETSWWRRRGCSSLWYI